MILILLKIIVIIAVVIGLVTAAFNKNVRKWVKTELVKYGWQVFSVVLILLIIYVIATQGA